MSNPGYSPYSPSDEANANANSPWSEQSGYDSLTLPPIQNFDDPFASVAPLNFFDVLPRLRSPGPFAERSNSNSTSQNHNHNQNHPPPSNQSAQRHTYSFSQYHVAGSESPDPFQDFIDLPSPPAMPITTRSSSVVDLTESSPLPLRRTPNPRKRKAETPAVGRASKTARPSSSRSASTRGHGLDDVQLVDLSGVDDEEEYQELRAREQAKLIKAQNEAEANKPVRLAAFECIICMSNPTDLTVTHCGHLFCSECLHHALYAGDKKCCPVCRSAISTPKTGAKQPKNGVFALEVKLMTANRKGKQPVKNR